MIEDNDEILKTAKERFRQATKTYGEYHAKCLDLAEFTSGSQWTYVARQNFENAGFTAITSNRIPTFLRQITNELRKNPPSIQVDPKDDGSKDTAEVLGDHLRNLQLECSANSAYAKAAELAAICGIGYLRVLSKYEDVSSFNQKLYIEAVQDSNTVMLDPWHTSLTGEDADFAFITISMSKDDYKRKYGGSDLAAKLNDAQWSSGRREWVKADSVIVCEYYFKDYENRSLLKLLDLGTSQETTKFKDELTPEEDDDIEKGSLLVQDTRSVATPVIRWCKLNDVEVLEQSTWPGNFIPVIAVKADEYWVEGKRKLVGAVEPAVDAQVKLNYATSYACQLMQMAPKAPYIGTASQFKTYEQQWANINVSNQAFIPYNKDEGVGPPQRDLGEVPIQVALALCKQAEEELQQIFGTFDPSNQTIAPESGKAILARQAQSYNSNYHFYDHLSASVLQVGRILLEAIPVFYDTPRMIQAVSKAGEKRSTLVNTMNDNGVIEHDFTKPGYSVNVETGPSFGTKRQESVEQFMDLMQMAPQLAINLADLAILNMDWPGAKEASARARAMIPPNILAADQSKDPAVAGLTAHVQQLTQQLQAEQMKLQQLEQQQKLEKYDVTVESMKIELEHKSKMRELDLKEAQLTTDYQVREQELELKRKELELQATEVAADVAIDTLKEHRAHAVHVANVAIPVSGDDEDLSRALSE